MFAFAVSMKAALLMLRIMNYDYISPLCVFQNALCARRIVISVLGYCLSIVECDMRRVFVLFINLQKTKYLDFVNPAYTRRKKLKTK